MTKFFSIQCGPTATHGRGFRAALMTMMAVTLSATAARAVTIDMVTVGDPGNPNDTINTGTTPNYGAVAESFQIMKYEWTNSQYVEFLNAVDPDGTNPNSIYNSNMGSDTRGGISFTSGSAAGTKYASRTNMGDKPVNFVSWFDAARVANWLQNGQGSSSTETGAYTLVGGQTSGTAPAVNPGATFYIPTEDQWYKAAYYKGGNTNAGYWKYATQVTGTAPIAVGATVVGTGSSGGVSPVISGNFANYLSDAVWDGQTGNVTTVGTNGGPSAYGAFDMSGNVFEWNDLTGAAGSSRGLRGGYWGSIAFDLSSSGRLTIDPSHGDDGVGFRLASPVSGPAGVPEIDAAGARLVAGLIVCGLALLERRRHGR
ncbi:MAG: PEP-CTERM sorting domain-containing protein [Ignavibacteria bacterium]|nr:PEP-CTERM sorting domain-containing protein [Ignavibacteria bacterium]